MIEMQRIRKHTDRTTGGERVSFVAADGMVTGLLGPNGAGKTTTMRAITGLTRPDAGGVEVDGVDVARDPCSARARVGVRPRDRRSLRPPHRSRARRLCGRELHRSSAPDLRLRASPKLLDRMGLAALADRRAGAAVDGRTRPPRAGEGDDARAANVVLDEPTNGLDVLSAREVRKRDPAAGRGGPRRAAVEPRHARSGRGVRSHRRPVARPVVADGTPADMRPCRVCDAGGSVRALIGSEEGLN